MTTEAGNPTPAPPAAPATPVAARLPGAALAAGAGFAVVAVSSVALDHGRDFHATRVLVVLAVMLPAALVLVRPNRTFEARAAVVCLAIAAGAFAWWLVPCRPGGTSLSTAVAKRDSLRAMMGPPAFDDVRLARGLRDGLDELAKDYPTLAAPLRPELDRWADAATDAVAGRLKEATPDDLAAARAARLSASTLAGVFPDRRERLDEALRAWVARAVEARAAELKALSPTDWDGFDRTSTGRHWLVREFPESRDELTSAEEFWVILATGHATADLLHGLKENPKPFRELCRKVEQRVRALKGLDMSPGRHKAARDALFSMAHTAAWEEVRVLFAAQDYEAAFTLAVRHDFDWLSTTQILGPEEQKRAAELRELTRYFAVRAGDRPEVAPEPRSREEAPPPRAKR